MTAFNVVRFRVKPGRDREFIDAHRNANPSFAGMRRFSLLDTGAGTYCIIGEWDSMERLAAARPGMIGMLDTFRHLLEDIGGGMGVTDPVSGTALVEIGATKKARTKPKKASKPAKRKAAKKKAVKKKTAKRKKT